MKHTRKYAAALAVAIAGSVFCASLPAQAGGIELEKVDIVFRRNHDDARGYNYPDRGPDMPPPPPPPPHHGPHCPGRMPPPHHAHAFGPGGPHMPPPPPPHHGPRHMPPPHHRW